MSLYSQLSVEVNLLYSNFPWEIVIMLYSHFSGGRIARGKQHYTTPASSSKFHYVAQFSLHCGLFSTSLAVASKSKKKQQQKTNKKIFGYVQLCKKMGGGVKPLPVPAPMFGVSIQITTINFQTGIIICVIPTIYKKLVSFHILCSYHINEPRLSS